MNGKEIAYETMKEFVEKYDNIIKPAIEKGNIKYLEGIVMENDMKYNIIKKELRGQEYKPLAHFRFVINLLMGLIKQSDEIKEDTFNYALRTIESQVQNLNKYLTN